MSDSVLSHPADSKSNRLDPPHDLMTATEEGTPWMALAGRDASSSSEQLDRQTSELLAYVRQQNDEIDARQAELNAKLAQLDNELRSARLRSGLDAGADLIGEDKAENAVAETAQAKLVQAASSMEHGVELDEIPPPAAPKPPVNPQMPQPITTPPQNPNPTQNFSATTLQEFEEVEKIVAQLSSPPQPGQETPYANPVDEQVINVMPQPLEADRAESDHIEPSIEKAPSQVELRVDLAHQDDVKATQAKSPKIEVTNEPKPTTETKESQRRIDSFPEMLNSSHLSRLDSGVDIQAMATSLDASEMESERRLLAERKIELDRRKAVLQRMQDDTQALHREALEMRLVTEQLWIEISDKAPADHITELLETLRGRLDEEYKSQQQVVDDRKAELVELKDLIERKQEDLRDQSRKLQEWVESRHDDIKSYAAQVDAREMLLDRREHRMQEEFSKWEATRNAYQQQLQSVLAKLNLNGIGE